MVGGILASSVEKKNLKKKVVSGEKSLGPSRKPDRFRLPFRLGLDRGVDRSLDRIYVDCDSGLAWTEADRPRVAANDEHPYCGLLAFKRFLAFYPPILDPLRCNRSYEHTDSHYKMD